MGNGKEHKLSKHFEAILGINFENEVVYNFRHNIAIQTVSRGSVTTRNFGTMGNNTKGCSNNGQILNMSGFAKTDGNGSVEIMILDFLCGDHTFRVFQTPAIVVATPRSMSPVFVTTRALQTPDQRNLKISFKTWEINGAPAPNIFFNWFCQVPYLIRNNI